MRKFASALLVLGTSAIALAGYDGRLRMDNPANNEAYQAVRLSGYIGELGFPADPDGNSFFTFCVERNEYFQPGGTYDVNINTAAVQGGVGGGSPDPLDQRTAYLYWNYRLKTLTGFDYSNQQADSQRLQDAIWMLEDEMTVDSNNKFYKLANDAINNGDWTVGIGNVRILNMWNGPGGDNDGHNQDFLTIVPTPAASLLGIAGLLAATAFRRR